MFATQQLRMGFYRSLPRSATFCSRTGHAIRLYSSSGANDGSLKLAYDRYDPKGVTPKGEPIVFVHGLFGSKVNNRTVSKVLARDLQKSVFCIDLRNHGDSPHDPRHDYNALAEDVENFIEEHKLGPSILIGHSMGAKTVMGVALRQPDLVRAVIPVDNAPIDAKLGSSFWRYVRGMKKIADAKVTNQKEAYKIMAEEEESLPVQQFLLSNMQKKDGVYEFRVPLDILGKSLDNMAEFPFSKDSRYTGPALFIRGTKST